MSKDKKKKVTENQWKAVQMALTLKDKDNPFYKTTLQEYVDIKKALNSLSYICTKCGPENRVVEQVTGIMDANTGEFLDATDSINVMCSESDKHPIIDCDELYDFESEYGLR